MENVHFQRGLISVAEAGANWRPPSRKEVLGTLLDEEHKRVHAGVAAARSTTARVGVVVAPRSAGTRR
jgi:hypothetical protein